MIMQPLFQNSYIGSRWKSAFNLKYWCTVYVHKCLNGHAPAYLASCFTCYSQTRAGLRSASDNTRLAENKPSRKSLQSATYKSFPLAAPGLWNNLPITIRTSVSTSVPLPFFKKALNKDSGFCFKELLRDMNIQSQLSICGDLQRSSPYIAQLKATSNQLLFWNHHLVHSIIISYIGLAFTAHKTSYI